MAKQKNNHKNNNQKNLLGDHSAEKKELLFYIVIFSICAVIMFAWVIPNTFRDKTPDNTDTPFVAETELDLNIESTELLSEVQWTIWFELLSVSETGTVTFSPESGLIMKVDKTTGEMIVEPIDSIDVQELNQYSFVWIFDNQTAIVNYNSLNIHFENVAVEKDTGIYLTYNNDTYQFHSEQRYNELKETSNVTP